MIRKIAITLDDDRVFYVYPLTDDPELADLTDANGNLIGDADDGMTFSDAGQQVIIPTVNLIGRASRNLYQIPAFTNAATEQIELGG